MTMTDSALHAWLVEHEQNALTLAASVGTDTKYWLEEAKYFQAATSALELLQEWDRGEYDGRDFLRRVRLVLHAGKPRVSLASLRGIARPKKPA